MSWGVKITLKYNTPKWRLQIQQYAMLNLKTTSLVISAGLYLLVNPTGSKLLRLKYRFAAKEKMLSIGAYPIITLAEAREKALAAKKQLINNIDPSQFKKEEKLQRLIKTENSFESVAIEWHDITKERWTLRHAYYVFNRIKNDLFNVIGFRPINEITAPELLVALRKIEARGTILKAYELAEFINGLENMKVSYRLN